MRTRWIEIPADTDAIELLGGDQSGSVIELPPVVTMAEIDAMRLTERDVQRLRQLAAQTTRTVFENADLLALRTRREETERLLRIWWSQRGDVQPLPDLTPHDPDPLGLMRGPPPTRDEPPPKMPVTTDGQTPPLTPPAVAPAHQIVLPVIRRTF